MKKRLLSFALTLIMLLTLLPVQAIASTDSDESSTDYFYVTRGNTTTVSIRSTSGVEDWYWSVNDTSIASIEDTNWSVTIDDSGTHYYYSVTIKGLKTGSTSLYFRNGSNTVLYLAYIVVSTPVSSIVLSQESAYLETGDSLQLQASVMPSDADDTSVNWTSSNEAVAVVTSEGLVNTCGEGTAIISASSSDNKVTASCTIYSGKLTKSIAISNDSIHLTKDTPTEQLIIERNPADATFSDTVYSSSDPGIASVDENGLVTGYENGTVTITATSVDTGVSTSTEVFCSGFTRRLTNIEVVQAPDKREYYLGEQLDISGLIVKAYYNDGSEETIPKDKIVVEDNWYEETNNGETFRVNQYILGELGKHTVNLSYEGKEGAFTVDVIEGGTIDFGIVGDDITWLLYEDGRLIFNGSGEMFTDSSFESSKWLQYPKEIKSVFFDQHITALAGGSFKECSNLSKVELPKKITEIGNAAFYGCTSLKSITIPSTVTKIESLAFDSCTKLKKVTLPENLTTLGDNAFSECSSLEEVYIGKKLTKILWGTFGGCDKLKSINIPGNVTSIGDSAFFDCDELSEVKLNEGLATIEGDAFGNCYSLKSIIIPDSVTKIGDWAFSNCGLKKVIIGDGVTSIGEDAFVNDEITYLKLGDSVRTIKYEAFRDCDFKTIYIPKSVKKIEDRAFWNCLNLSHIYYEGSKTQWNKINIGSDNEEIDATTMHYNCPRAPEVTISNVASSGKIKLAWGAVDGASEYIIYRSTSKSGSYKKLKTTDKTSYTDTSAKAGKPYYYKVKAVSASKSSATSPSSIIVSRTCDLPRPAVNVSNVASSGKIKLTWKTIDGASEYYIYRSTSKSGSYTKVKETSNTSYTDTSVKLAKTYYYKVKAIHPKKSSAKSASSAVASSICKLPRPVITVCNVASSGKIKIAWKAIEGASKYYVYRATSKSGEYTRLTETEKTSYTDSSAKVGKTYYYKVKAIYSKTSSANSASSSVVSSICNLPRPTVTVTSTSAGKVKVSWKAVEGASEYWVYRATSKDGKYTKIKATSKLSYTDSSVQSGNTYYYKVKAVYSKNTAANSANSSAKSIVLK